MAVKSDVRYVTSKKDKSKKVKKTTYKCEGSYVDIDGKSHRYHKRGFATSEEAKEWERSLLLKVKAEVDSEITFDELFKIYMEYKKPSIKESSYYEVDKLYGKHLKPFFGNMRLSNIKIKVIDKFKSELLKKEYTNKTLEKIQVRLKAIFKFGYSKGYIKDFRISMFENAKKANERRKEMKFWQPNDFAKFISVVDEPVYVAYFNVLYWCGIRNGEALALTWDDVDFEKNTLSVNKTYSKHTRSITTPKTSNSYRSVIIPNECIKALFELYNIHIKIIGFSNDKFVFNFNKPLDDNSIRIKKDRWITMAGVERIRIHDFRHSHVSLLINLGFNAFDIAKRLGHSPDMVNNVYGHWFNEVQQKMVDKLDEVSKKMV